MTRTKLTAGLYWYPEHKVLAVKRRWGWMVLIANDEAPPRRWLQRSIDTLKDLETCIANGTVV